MRTRCWREVMVSTVFLSIAGLVIAAEDDQTVRPPIFARIGWYPNDPTRLTKTVDKLMAQSSPPRIEGKPIAVIAPHAGYDYSAPVAAAGYRCLQGHKYKRVIVLAFNHQYSHSYNGADVPAELTAYQTPLGNVPIDRKMVDQLRKEKLFVSIPGMHQSEHSLELQLPFLQRAIQDFKLVPVLVGRMSVGDYASVAQTMLPFIDEDTLLVASSDFTHYGSRYGYQPFKDDVPSKLAALADQAAKPIQQCDFDGFAHHVSETKDTICGRGPILLLLRILSMMRGIEGTRTAYDTSGNIVGDWENSVTYQSFVFTRREGNLSHEEREILLNLARRTVNNYITGKELPKLEADKLSAALRNKGACFVTLNNHGQLRGCIGLMKAMQPLHECVSYCAVQACKDFRFVNDPVTADELKQIDIEISYLTPMKRIKDINEIIIGRHGLKIELGRQSGTLLPQVASERGWTREEFLAHLCMKARLPIDAWKQPAAKLYSYEAEVFGEKEMKPTSTQPAGHE